jgi:hypothetical protein
MGSRLRALGPDGLDVFPITLNDNIKMARVRRDWMKDHYGGSTQGGRTPVNIKKWTHGTKFFNFMRYDYNPDAPKHPGAPGIIFGCYGDDPNSSRRDPLLMRSTIKREDLWRYMGLYESIPSTPLTKEEWHARPAHVCPLKYHSMN